MKLYDTNRLSGKIPFAENVADFTLEGAKEASRNCEKCDGGGFASIFNPRYEGRTIEVEISPRQGKKQVLMRTNAYCVCPVGRKTAVVHQQSAKDVFLRIPDYHDVAAGKYYDWQTDDPTDGESQPMHLSRLPEAFKRLLDQTRPRIYHEPQNGHAQINQMFGNHPEAV